MSWFAFWRKITFRQALRYKTTLLFLMFCLSLLVLVVQLIGDFSDAGQSLREHTYGSQHGFVFECSEEVLNNLVTDERVEVVGLIELQGYAVNPLSSLSDTVGLGTMNESARQLANIELIAGDWPQNEQEVVIEEITLLKLRLSAEIGDIIDLDVIGLKLDLNGEPVMTSQNYRIVGIIRDFAYMQYHPEQTTPPSADYLRLPGIITGSIVKQTAAPVSLTASLKLKDGVAYATFFQEIAGRYARTPDLYYLNSAVYPLNATLQSTNGAVQNNLSGYFPGVNRSAGYNDTAVQASKLLKLLIFFLIAILLMSSLASILIFRKKFAEDIEKLRLAGAATTQSVLAASWQTGLYLLLVLPGGLLFGILASWILASSWLPALIPFFRFSLQIGTLLLVLFSYAILMMTSSLLLVWMAMRHRPLAVDALSSFRNREYPQRKPGKSDPTRPIWLWVSRSFQENRAALASVLFSFVLSFAAILISAFLIVQLQQSAVYYSRYDIVISNSATGFMSNLKIPTMQTSFAAADLDNLSSIGEIETIVLSNDFYVNLISTQQQDKIQHYLSLGFEDTESGEIFDPQVTAEQKIQYGYDPDERILTGHISGFTEEIFKRLQPYVVAGQIDMPGLMNGRSVVLLTADRSTMLQVGDKLTLTQIINPEHPERQDVQVDICAVVFLPERTEGLPFNPKVQPTQLIWGYQSFSLFGQMERINSVDINLKDYNDDDEVRKAVQNLIALYPDAQIVMRSQEEQQIENTSRIIRLIAYGLVFVFLGFSLFSLYSFNQAMAVRNRRLIGALRAGGFSWVWMKRLKMIESALALAVSFLMGHILAIAFVVVIISDSKTDGLSEKLIGLLNGYPVIPVGIGLPILFLLVFGLYLMPIRSLYHLPICDLIREL